MELEKYKVKSVFCIDKKFFKAGDIIYVEKEPHIKMGVWGTLGFYGYFSENGKYLGSYDAKTYNNIINLLEKIEEEPLPDKNENFPCGSFDELFLKWADSYFTAEKLDKCIPVEDINADFEKFSQKELGYTSFPSHLKFKASMVAYCNYKDYELNPQSITKSNASDRILILVNGKLIEHWYVQSIKSSFKIQLS